MFQRYEMLVAWARLPSLQIRHAHCLGVSPFSSSETEQLPDSVYCPSEAEHKTSETAHTLETSIFSHIEHISHQYPMKVKFLHK
jgi:hypothetical protein